jgi:hypothetical protein
MDELKCPKSRKTFDKHPRAHPVLGMSISFKGTFTVFVTDISSPVDVA